MEIELVRAVYVEGPSLVREVMSVDLSLARWCVVLATLESSVIGSVLLQATVNLVLEFVVLPWHGASELWKEISFFARVLEGTSAVDVVNTKGLDSVGGHSKNPCTISTRWIRSTQE
jgi:hypothetical protein